MQTLPAINVARHLLHLAAPVESEDADRLCHLRLQKLLYYVQGWHLGIFGTPVYPETLVAWKHGPVVKDVYPVFSRFGSQAIPTEEGSPIDGVSERVASVIQMVWKRYGAYSPSALRAKTHKEAPWVVARIGVKENDNCDSEITHRSMRDYFMIQYMDTLKRVDPRINTKLWASSADAFFAGRFKSVREIRNELSHLGAGPNSGST